MGRRAVWRLGAVVVAVVLVVAGASTGAAQDSPAYDRYVALGDSYTSGPFIPFQRLNPLGCGRSTNNYPSLLAAALEAEDFVDVSCAGATTDHLTEAQDVFAGRNAPQFDALTAETDLVTIGIGGNDFNVFGDLVEVCPEVRADDPTGSPCREHFGEDGVDIIGERIARMEKRVEAALREIQERSPDADVYVIGYPRIVPDSGTCPETLPFADGDYGYLDEVEQSLNAALAAAAERASVTYVDTYGPSHDHDACGEAGQAWIQGQDLNIFWAAPYHPNLFGMRGITGTVFEAATSTPMAGTAEERVAQAIDRVRDTTAADRTFDAARRLADGLALRHGIPAARQLETTLSAR